MDTGQNYTWKFDGFLKGIECEFEVSGTDLTPYTAYLIITGKYGSEAIVNPTSERLVVKVCE